VFKEERERARLDVNFGSHHKYRLESNSLFPNIVLSVCPYLGALADPADGSDIFRSKAIFVAIDDNCIRADRKLDERLYTKSFGSGIMVVFCILD
jgi:hypothetical protein